MCEIDTGCVTLTQAPQRKPKQQNNRPLTLDNVVHPPSWRPFPLIIRDRVYPTLYYVLKVDPHLPPLMVILYQRPQRLLMAPLHLNGDYQNLRDTSWTHLTSSQCLLHSCTTCLSRSTGVGGLVGGVTTTKTAGQQQGGSRTQHHLRYTTLTPSSPRG